MKKLPKLAEQENAMTKRKMHIRWIHPHLAREKNLSHREKLELALDRLSKKLIKGNQE